MLEVGPRTAHGVSGRFYREFRGDRYWFWPKRGYYVSQKGGRQRLLHREAFGSGAGEIIPVNGDWDDFAADNWRERPKNTGRDTPSKHDSQEFLGVCYYLQPWNGYYSRRYPRIEYMHRAVWAHHNGAIPVGHHVHHVNGDKGDNRIENLRVISAADHSGHHAKTSSWVGSARNKQQLVEAGKLAKAGRKTHSGECDECGAPFESIAKNRKFCCKSCRYKAEYRRYSGL